jgi:HEAT repeat protein
MLVLVVTMAVATPSPAQRPKKAAAREAVVSGKTISAWIKDLQGKAVLGRVGAINALIQAGPEARTAVAALVGTFRDRDATFLHPLAAVALARIGPDAVPSLEKALGDDAETVRGGAALALGLIGPSARPAATALTRALHDRSEVVRFAAAQALGRVGPGARTALPDLRKALEDKDSAVRVASAHALWLVASEGRGLSVLTAALRDPSPSVVQAAVVALGEMGTAAKSTAKELKALADKGPDPARRLQAAEACYRVGGDGAVVSLVSRELKSADVDTRRLAVAVLGTLGREANAVKLLVGLLGDKNALVRREAACALADRSVEAPANLRAALHDADVGVRWWSAVALSASGANLRKDEEAVLRALRLPFARVDEKETPPARTIQEVQAPAATRAVPALVEVLKKRPARFGVEAARALALLGLDARSAEPALVDALKSGDKLVHRSAADALGQMGTEVLPTLKRLLTNPDARLREGAARALGQMGLPARSAIKGLTAALKDDASPVRTQAALALWNIEQDAELALPVLTLVLKDVDNRDRWEAVDAIGQISVEVRPPIKGMTEVLLGAAKDRDPRVRVYAAKWLFRRVRKPLVVAPLLRDGVTDRDVFVRLSAVAALGELGAEGRIMDLMATALQDRDVTVRLAAEEGLARGGAAMVPHLVEALKNRDPRIRAGVARALERIGPAAKEAVKPLLQQARDSNQAVRSAAVAALRSILRGQEEELKKLQDINDFPDSKVAHHSVAAR